MRVSFEFIPRFFNSFPQLNLFSKVRAIAARSFAGLASLWQFCSSRFFGRGEQPRAPETEVPANPAPAAPGLTPREQAAEAAERRLQTAPMTVAGLLRQRAMPAGAPAATSAVPSRVAMLAAVSAVAAAPAAATSAAPSERTVPAAAPAAVPSERTVPVAAPAALARAAGMPAVSRAAPRLSPAPAPIPSTPLSLLPLAQIVAAAIQVSQQALVFCFFAPLLIAAVGQCLQSSLQLPQDAARTATELRARASSISDSTDLAALQQKAERTANFCRFRLIQAMQKMDFLVSAFRNSELPLRISLVLYDLHFSRQQLAFKTAQACVDILNGGPSNHEQVFLSIRARGIQAASLVTAGEVSEEITAAVLSANTALQNEATEYSEFLGGFSRLVEARQAALR